MHFVPVAVYQNVKSLSSKIKMQVYNWKIFYENAVEMVSVISSNRASEAQTFRTHEHFLSSYRTQWKHLVFSNEWVSCIHVWRIPLSVVLIHVIVHHKSGSGTDGSSLSRKNQMCSCVKCIQVSGNFSLMLSIWATSWENLFMTYAKYKGADQPAHPCCLINAFIVDCLDSIIPLLAIAEISRP